MKDINLVLQEIDKHEERLKYVVDKIKSWNGLNTEIFDDPEKVETIDAFLFRFSKMQDTMGEKLFPLILEVLGEESRNKPFIDILNRLEQLEFLPSVNEWKELRKISNLITDIYPWEQEMLIKELQQTIEAAEKLMKLYDNIKEKIKPYIRGQ
ncbi:hypothetical protein [Persephonella sp. KM09-Lau-8]|uniref:hypothetical protein n=1 Tax=Persephonella sp. KM09-Lau-8 TaxID=1158345 RepID=UPI00068F0E56|nr:hypothetical protein [Persephonella sp. KM09-Lau-8]